MNCSACGHENPPGAKFCGECGSPLALTCPHCSAANPPGNKFCGECGGTLSAASPGTDGNPSTAATRMTPAGRTERRMVSVLFADLVGFTAFSEARDPEEVRAMLTRYFERSREIIERFRGSVEKFIGDAVMAWWGAVEAREDDAERAVRAALELVDMVSELGTEIGVPELALRAGVLTGETSVAPGTTEQGALVGDLVNTASRLQSIAAPGTAVVGESTRALVAGAVEFQPLGEHTVKGKELPVAAFRALRIVAQRGGRGRAEGLEPPFVGRQDELRLLKDQLHAASRESRARLVSIVGDAGIGKSRLAWELQKYIDGIADTIYWHHGRSPAYGDGIAFWALGEMIRGRAGIGSDDDKGKARLKLRTSVAEHVAGEEERRWIEPRLAGLLGLDPMPPGDRNELFAAIRTFFHRIAEQATVVLAFEDLHWADDGVLDFITDLVERSTHHSILVITMSRPELLQRHPGWGSGRRNQLATHLAPLPDVDMRSLVTGLAPGIPDDAADAVVARAAGIPLYAVEFVRMLIGSGDLQRQGDAYVLTGDLGALTVPDSLAAVIGARLDRLDPDDRALVQDAAVLGQSFTLTGLAAIRGTDHGVLREALDGLIRQELLELDDDPRSPERGQYRFVQGVIREVAYGRLAKSDRHERHRRVAEYFAGLEDPEVAGVVANHFLAAHETAPPGTEGLLERGRSALLGAAERAVSLQAHAQALSLYRQALGLAATTAAERSTILLDAATAAAWAGDHASVDLAREAVEAMEELDDADGLLRARTTLGWTLNNSARSDEAAAALQEPFRQVEALDTPAKVALGLEVARALMMAGQFDESIAVADRVLPAAERIASPADLIGGIITKATAIGFRGQVMESQAILSGAIDVADEHGLQAQALRARNNLGIWLLGVDPMGSVRSIEDLAERGRRLGGTAWLENARSQLAEVYILCGRFAEVEDLLSAADPEQLPVSDRELRQIYRFQVDWARDGDTGALERLDAAADQYWSDSTDFQVALWRSWYLASSRMSAGAWDEAYDLAVDTDLPQAVGAALESAGWMRDRERVNRAIAVIGERLPRGRYRDALNRLGEALALVLGGEREHGAERFRSGLEELSHIGLPMEIARWQALFGLVVGLDHPDAMAAATRAKEWLRRVGALGVERLVAPGLPGDELESERQQAV